MRLLLISSVCIAACAAGDARSAEPRHLPAATRTLDLSEPAESPAPDTSGAQSEVADAPEPEGSEPVAVAPDAAPADRGAEVERAVSDDGHALVLVEGRLFGCALLPVVDRSLARRLPGAVDNGETYRDRTGRDLGSGPLPSTVTRTLLPRLESLRVPSAEGMCSPQRGPATPMPTYLVRFVEVRERLAGCTRMSTFAFANCELPDWLRYERLRYRIESLPRSGQSDDPRVAALVEDPDTILRRSEDFADDWPAGWRRLLRRRQRIGSVALGAEELAAVETHWQIGGDSCPYEDVTQGVFVRDPGGPWRRVQTPGGLPVGVFHDGARVVGLDLLGRLDPEDRHGGARNCGGLGPNWHADCHGASIAARRDVDQFQFLRSVHWNFMGGAMGSNDISPLLRYSDGHCQS